MPNMSAWISVVREMALVGSCEQRKNRRQGSKHRQPGRIVNHSDVPTAAEYAGQPAKAPVHKGESRQIDERDKQQEAESVVSHIVPHLVTEYRQYFVMRSLVQKIVVESDPRRSEKARDVGRDAIGLPRSVRHVDIVRWNTIGSRQCKNIALDRKS